MQEAASSFDRFAEEYDRWFDEHPEVYQSEVSALERFVPRTGSGIEIGVGSGRFALPLQAQTGVDPALQMARIARERGIDVVLGEAEALPFCRETFDFALMVTAVCFFDNLSRALAEAHRILVPGGQVVIALIDRDSPLGEEYSRDRETSRFFRLARFYTTNEVISLLNKNGFSACESIDVMFRKYGPIPSGFSIVRACK
ncbi:MAG: methyltransferase domain-containing protein [Methanomicrobiales archaeon]|nr:methyltransferase domain-containing protein [Methanomicrobiales archaeon]